MTRLCNVREYRHVVRGDDSGGLLTSSPLWEYRRQRIPRRTLTPWHPEYRSAAIIPQVPITSEN